MKKTRSKSNVVNFDNFSNFFNFSKQINNIKNTIMIQYNNFLIKREQSRAGSRFAECEKSRLKAKILMTLALLLTAVGGAWAQGPWTSGDCTVTISGDVMTVSGAGAMADYDDTNFTPWYGYCSDIKTLVIESGVTSIGKFDFSRFEKLESVSIPASVTSIGQSALGECGTEATTALTVSFAEGSKLLTIGDVAFRYANLKSIDIPNGVTSIGEQVFYSCSNLESVSIPASVTSIGSNAFYNCSAISDVYLYANPDNLTWGDASWDFKDVNATQCHVLAEHLSTYQTKFGSSVNVTFVGDLQPLSAPITVEWNPSTKTGTFSMPGSDVVLTPLYAPAAKWDVVESVDQKPAALEGIIAGQDEAIVTPGQSAQGTVMYAVTTTADAAPALTAFSATVPTAKDVADDGATLYVWYYIQGKDTPQGQQATEENTFNDSEISTTPLTVQVLTNKFDIQFTAANDNTIQAGKATVTVDGQSATVTDGKLQGVKMGSEVKMTAKPGYKFRKVEVKKKEAGKPLANATAEDLGKVVGADGNIYDTKDAAEAANTTAVAMIAYVGSETADDTYTNGLAIALADEADKQNQATANSTCANKTAVTGAKWMLPKLQQVFKMCAAYGGDAYRHFGLDNALATAGGNKMSGAYWTSTQREGSPNRYYQFTFSEKYDTWNETDSNYDVINLVRACLAF